MIALVTGANGFVGRNLCAALASIDGLEVRTITSGETRDDLAAKVTGADCIFHLAGCNRPTDPADFQRINHGLTSDLCEILKHMQSNAKVILSSSTQAALENDYGRSKLASEAALEALSAENGNPVAIFRLTNVFGKWARPNYNSAVATFAFNILNGLPIEVSDPSRVMNLVYIDDVVSALINSMNESFGGVVRPEVEPVHQISLGEIVEILQSIHASRQTLVLPDLSRDIVKRLYATYTSYQQTDAREYTLDIKSDPRGSLAEFLKSSAMGQIFISRTKPGITRGNHYHNTKPEKFLVLEGEALIKLRRIDSEEVQEHRVTGEEYKVVEMTPGWTHSIENIGPTTLVTLFWAGEIFDPQNPDTVFVPVHPQEAQ